MKEPSFTPPVSVTIPSLKSLLTSPVTDASAGADAGADAAVEEASVPAASVVAYGLVAWDASCVLVEEPQAASEQPIIALISTANTFFFIETSL